MEEFRVWLAEQLDKRGWSRSEFARRTGLSAAQVSRIMNGDRPGIESCNAIADALGRPQSEIVRRAGLIRSYPVSDLELEQLKQVYIMLPEETRKIIYKSICALVADEGKQ